MHLPQISRCYKVTFAGTIDEATREYIYKEFPSDKLRWSHRQYRTNRPWRDGFIFAYGGTMLQKRLHNATDEISCLIKKLACSLLEAAQSDARGLYDIYTRELCQAFAWESLAREPFNVPKDHRIALPTAAAAVGNLALLQSLVTSRKAIYKSPTDWLPCIFKAAVITGKQTVVEWILKGYVHPEDARYVDFYRPYCIRQALVCAAQCKQHDVGLLIADRICAIEPGIINANDSIRRCAMLGSDDMVIKLLRYQSRDPKRCILLKETRIGPPVSKRRALEKQRRNHFYDLAYNHANERVFRRLIAEEYIHPVDFGRFHDGHPIDEAMLHGRFRLTMILMEHGANINATDHGITPLDKAVLRNDRDSLITAIFLIERSADIEPVLYYEDEDDRNRSLALCKSAAAYVKGKDRQSIAWREFWTTHKEGLLKECWSKYFELSEYWP